ISARSPPLEQLQMEWLCGRCAQGLQASRLVDDERRCVAGHMLREREARDGSRAEAHLAQRNVLWGARHGEAFLQAPGEWFQCSLEGAITRISAESPA